MSAARYTDWAHVHIAGDRDAAAPYLSEARKLLGYVVEDARRNALGVYALRRELNDGTVILAELRGGVPRITIAPVGEAAREIPARVLDDFVVWARDAAHPAGIDTQHPQQILRPADDAAWRTFFYDAEVAGGTPITGASGTYIDVFPDGLRYAGNVDWHGPGDVRLSWYGPSSRYWLDCFRQPRAQYGRYVFCLGQILLDVDDYCLSSEVDFAERLVLGAAMRGAWLYVMMAALPDVTSTPPPAPTATPDAWATHPYPLYDVPLVLRRFRLADAPTQPDPMKLRVVEGSHETAWSATLARAAGPWVFNTEGTEAVTQVPPESCQFFLRGETWVRPATSHLRIVLTIAEDAVTRADSVHSLAPGVDQGAILAQDGAATLELVRAVSGFNEFAFDERFDYRLGEVRYPAWLVAQTEYVQRRLLWADLRAGVLVLFENRLTDPDGFAGSTLDSPPRTSEIRLLVCRNGAVTPVFEFVESGAFANAAFVLMVVEMLRRMGEQAVAPLAFVHLHVFGAVGPGFTANLSLAFGNTQGARPFRSADLHGEIRVGFSMQSWFQSETIPQASLDTAQRLQVDALDHTTTPALATRHGITLLSASTGWYIGNDEVQIHHATGSDLGALTGVAGEQARYHPIWLLGKPPQPLVT